MGGTDAPSRRSDNPLSRTGNLLGALGLVLIDQVSDATAESAGEAGSAGIALSALHQFLERPTIDMLRRVLGLTHSGAVRLVDRLEARGLVQRGRAEDGRATAVILTASGRRVARRVSGRRARVLSRALAVLDPDEQERLGELLSRILVGLMRTDEGAVRWMCRLCDMDACGWHAGRCPVRSARESG